MRRRARSSALGVLLLLARSAWAAAAPGAYVRSESHVGEDFFSRWTFWDGPDPTGGFVDFVSREVAEADGLAKATSGRVFMGADATTVAGPGGRRSVRIQTKSVYNSGLFVIALDHMPTGCGTWPAFWMFGEDATHIWPRWGEYDIIEGVHKANRVITTLHTRPGCDQAGVRAGEDFTQKWGLGATPGAPADNCDVDAPGQWHNQGCSQSGPPASMGAHFNEMGGGTYAAEWDSAAGYIRTWFWPGGSEPADLRDQRPDPGAWGTPYSYFRLASGTCSSDHFRNMRMVFDLTFCGDLGNPTFLQSCPQHKMTCNEYVAQHPESFSEAYWSIRALDVYQRQDKPGSPSPVPPTLPSAAPATPPPPAITTTPPAPRPTQHPSAPLPPPIPPIPSPHALPSTSAPPSAPWATTPALLPLPTMPPPLILPPVPVTRPVVPPPPTIAPAPAPPGVATHTQILPPPPRPPPLSPQTPQTSAPAPEFPPVAPPATRPVATAAPPPHNMPDSAHASGEAGVPPNGSAGHAWDQPWQAAMAAVGLAAASAVATVLYRKMRRGHRSSSVGAGLSKKRRALQQVSSDEAAHADEAAPTPPESPGPQTSHWGAPPEPRGASPDLPSWAPPPAGRLANCGTHSMEERGDAAPAPLWPPSWHSPPHGASPPSLGQRAGAPPARGAIPSSVSHRLAPPDYGSPAAAPQRATSFPLQLAPTTSSRVLAPHLPSSRSYASPDTLPPTYSNLIPPTMAAFPTSGTGPLPPPAASFPPLPPVNHPYSGTGPLPPPAASFPPLPPVNHPYSGPSPYTSPGH